MRRLPVVLAAAVLAVAACGPDSNDSPDPAVVEACNEYHRLMNQWGSDYGAERGEVGQAVAEGDESRREDAVPAVRELFRSTADGLRAQAEQAPDQELADALTDAADGLVEISEQIETYEDVEAVPEMMSEEEGTFASGGERVSTICAG